MLKELFHQAARLQEILNGLNVPFAFIGGIANAVHGHPRTTLDADVLIFVPEGDIAALIRQLGNHARLLPEMPFDFASKMRVIPCEFPEGLRVDLVLAGLEFEKSALQRARLLPVLESLALQVCTAEDLVIMKMISTRMKDRGDVAGIIRRQRDKLDAAYVTKWLKDFEGALERSDLVREFRKIHSASKT